MYYMRNSQPPVVDRTNASKKRKSMNACTFCKKRKLRCDREESGSSDACAACIERELVCTYVEPDSKRYVNTLKARIAELEAQLEQSTKLTKLQLENQSPFGDMGECVLAALNLPTPSSGPAVNEKLSIPLPKLFGYASASKPVSCGSRSLTDSVQAEVHDSNGVLLDAEEPVIAPGLMAYKRQHPQEIEDLTCSFRQTRFFGKSSGALLISNATRMKQALVGSAQQEPVAPDSRWSTGTSRGSSMLGVQNWNGPPKEWAPTIIADVHLPYQFPADSTLLHDLVDIYFNRVNVFMPLLHHPTFERSLASGQHLMDENPDEDSFGTILLLVMSIGSRYSDDPRVLLDPSTRHSAGWGFFNQVSVVRKSVLSTPTLYTLQFYCLAAGFLQGSTAPQGSWKMSGIGLRLGIDIGIHRRKNQPLTAEEELRKRAFWILLLYDRLSNCGLGRSPCLEDENFDQELPLEVDDEYWGNSNLDETLQPPGKPSTVAYINRLLWLSQISNFAQRTIYSTNPPKFLLGSVGDVDWDRQIVSHIDSALNNWADVVPEHLRWNPQNEHPVFAVQSASLYGAFHYVPIFVHRPFLLSRKPKERDAFPSLAIATNAARACCHVFDRQKHREAFFGLPDLASVFNAGVILLLASWTSKRSGANFEASVLDDTKKCMAFLKRHECRWPSAVKLGEMLDTLANVGDIPMPENTPSFPSHKRGRETGDTFESLLTDEPLSVDSDGLHVYAGGRRATNHANLSDNRRLYHSSDFSFVMPMPMDDSMSNPDGLRANWMTNEQSRVVEQEAYTTDDLAFLEELAQMESMYFPTASTTQPSFGNMASSYTGDDWSAQLA